MPAAARVGLVYEKEATMAAAKEEPRILRLSHHAEEIRKELHVPNQNEVFRAAVEAGYLAALADGVVDATELHAIARAAEILSVGAVIEWEAETLVEECVALAEKQGAEVRADAVGARLKELGQPEAGLLFASLIAAASGGVVKKEAQVLERISKAAGVPTATLKALVKRAAAALGELAD